jgi:hypothetical protein
VRNMGHRSPHLRVLGARCPFSSLLRPYSPGGAARGSHTGQFSCFGPRAPCWANAPRNDAPRRAARRPHPPWTPTSGAPEASIHLRLLPSRSAFGCQAGYSTPIYAADHSSLPAKHSSGFGSVSTMRPAAGRWSSVLVLVCGRSVCVSWSLSWSLSFGFVVDVVSKFLCLGAW